MSLKALLEKIKSNQELSQASMRIVLAASFTVVLFLIRYFYKDFLEETIIVSAEYVLFSMGWFLLVYLDIGIYHIRRVLGTISDLSIFFYGVAASNIVAASLYPLILWVIIVNGFRYGVKYLYFTLFMAVVLLQIVTYNNPSWQEHQELSIMMTLGLIGLPILFSHLLNKVSKLNKELTRKTRDLEHRLYYDSMTELPNREALQREISKDNYHALILIDVNNFTHFNDFYGLNVGNEILVNLSKHLKNLSSKMGMTVYRLSGDSYVLLHADSKENEHFNKKMQTIIEELDFFETFIESLQIKIKINFTIATVLAQENVLEKANMTLHFARKKGEKYWVYDASINRKEEVENILYWEKEIYRAIVEDRIVPVFHPISNIHGEVVKYEVLMRLLKKEGALVKLYSPAQFLDIAIKTNQYEDLTAIMIEKSFYAMKDKGCDFSINLTFSNIQNKNMVMFLKSKIDEYKLGHRLILEIVESEDIYNFEIVKTFVAYLRLLGVRFAIDDFGTGYANYMHVFEVMPEFIKLDGSLIQSIDKDEHAHKFVASIVLLAKNLGIKTIAEFVHNEEIFRITKSLGVDEFQGSYFSKPLTLEQLEEK